MSDKTKIEWTDATWNPITGCSIVSPGCTNCYAMKLAGTRLRHHPSRAGLTQETKAGPVWNGAVRFNEDWIDQPLRWKRPRMIFVCAHGDLFAEGVPDEWIDRVFAVMALAPQHKFQVLTKRAERMRSYVSDPGVIRRVYELVCDTTVEERLPVVLIAPGVDEALAPPGPRIPLDQWPLTNVWLGVSAEDQRRADERVPILLDTPAAVRWVSAEPLLGPINFAAMDAENDRGFGEIDALRGIAYAGPAVKTVERLDWIVAGGESGRGARPMHRDWVRSIRDQCAEANLAFHFKQWGAWASAKGLPSHAPIGHVFDDGFQMVRLGKGMAGRILDGVTHDAFPEDRHG